MASAAASTRPDGSRRRFLIGSLAAGVALCTCGRRVDPADSIAPVTSTGTDAPVVPEGFAVTGGRLVDPSGAVTELCLWVADDSGRQARGLMYVTDLGGADGMVFVFDRPTELHFYMWQTPMALTIAFFDELGGLVGTADMEPCADGRVDRCARYAPDGPYVHALEVPAGSLDSVLVDGVRLELDAVTAPGGRGCAAAPETSEPETSGPGGPSG